MPELPEVEIVKRSLFKKINKVSIVDIKVKNKNLRYKIPRNFATDLIGQKILRISRRSKYLIFYFKKKLLLVHLGMSGKFILTRTRDRKMFKTSFYYDLNIIQKHNHIYFKLGNGFTLIYNDVRRFGFFKIYNINELSKIAFLKKLGIEPLSIKFNNQYFKKFVMHRSKNIKNLLMDQTFVSGLGNIYVNEALFMTGINPLRLCNDIEKGEIKRLVLNIKKILKSSILKGGSSIKDFKNLTGKSGSFQSFFYVYGRENKNCSRNSCTGKIKKIFISNRSSFYCVKCQN